MSDLPTMEEIAEEIQKCKDSPYYFATKYLVLKTSDGRNIPFTTRATEKEFNEYVKKNNQ